jgi:hypothetical protein
MQFQHPFLHLGASAINGQGLFSTAVIRAGEIVAIWDGFIVPGGSRSETGPMSAIGIARRLAKTNSWCRTLRAADHVNHSCHPIAASVVPTLVAMRTSRRQGGVTMTSAMTDGCDYDVFNCGVVGALSRRIAPARLENPPLQTATTGGFDS